MLQPKPVLSMGKSIASPIRVELLTPENPFER